jgi:hypothetical protein
MLILSPRWLAVAFLTFTVTAARAEGPLVVKAPAGWTVSYQGSAQHYVVREEEGKVPVLMFSATSFTSEAADIPGYIAQISTLFIKESKNKAELADMNTNYVVEKIQGQAFSDEAAVFTLKNLVQTMFMISDGRGNWNGQFTGSAEDWQKAKGVLEGLKRSP